MISKIIKNLFVLLCITSQTALNGQRIAVQGQHFFLGEDTIWLNGANTPWDHWNDLGGDFDYGWWNDHFDELNRAGINSTRVWVSCNGGGGVKVDADGFVTGPTEAFWEDMDSLMAIARRHKVYLMAGLISFDHTKEGNPWYKEWRKMYSSEETMDSFVENYAVPLVKRYEDNPYLFSLDVCNEILWVSNTESSERGSISWRNIQYLVGKTAQRVHEESDVLVCVSNYLKYTSPNYGAVKWSDEALQSVVDNPLAYLDFYKIHYYSWVYPWFDGFHAEKTPAFYQIDDKPCITGEMSANAIYYEDKITGQNRYLMSTTEAYESHYQNGWQGAMAWTSNGVDSNGDLNNDLRNASLAFQKNHFDLVGQPHSAQKPADPVFQYGGRIDDSNLAAPVLWYPGSYIHTEFFGTSVRAVFSDYKSQEPQKIYCEIDSNIVSTIFVEPGEMLDTVLLADNLEESFHEIVITKALGPGSGSNGLRFLGLIPANDTAVRKALMPELNIEFFGSSIAAGAGSDCEGDGNCGEINAANSFADILGRMMNARIHNNSLKNLALLDGTGNYMDGKAGLESIYDKKIPVEGNGIYFREWKSEKFIPDLLIFNMGEMDEYEPENKAFEDTVLWKERYKYIIRDLVNDYGEDVKIILCPGNNFAENSAIYTSSVVDELAEDGYSIWYYRFSFDVGGYPGRLQHQAMAEELYDFIKGEGILEDENKNPYYDLTISIEKFDSKVDYIQIFQDRGSSGKRLIIINENDFFQASFSLVNISGAILNEKIIPVDHGRTSLELNVVPSGVYIVKLSGNGVYVSRKIVVN